MRSLYHFVFGQRSRTFPSTGSGRRLLERPAESFDYCGFGTVTCLPWVGLSPEEAFAEAV